MKTQQGLNNNNQGRSTSDRAFTDQNERLRENGISNSGGQTANETSNKKTIHHPEKKKG